jgi:hypothetical protein
VPWCPTCSKFLSPSTVRVDGTCPTCGRAVDAGQAHASVDEEETSKHAPIPWHLKLLVVALVIYLGFRAWQGIELLL